VNTIWTLIKLQFKAGARLERGKGPVKTAVKWATVGFVALTLLGVAIFFYHSLAEQFVGGGRVGVDLRIPFLTFTIAGFMVIQTLFLIPMLIKVLDINNDRELLLKLPLSNNQIFISKIVVAYLFELVFAAVILGPLMIAYGIAAGMAFWFYLVIIPLMILFVPVFPFFLAILVLFPMMKIAQFMKSRTSVTVLVYLAGLVGSVVLYMTIVQNMVHAIADAGFAETLEDNAGSIQNASNWLYPPRMFAGLADGRIGIFLLNLVIIIVSSAAMLALAYYIASLKYKKFYMSEHGTMSSFKAKGKYRGINATLAVLGKDSRNIFRSSNYTFQFLLIVVITPLLIFYSTRIAGYAVYQSFMNAGRMDMAFDMIFEVSIFITIVLIPLASAFAASNITREGGNIYHTKLIPVSFRRQLLIKTGIVFVPIFLSILIGVLLSMLNHTITATHVIPGLDAGQVIMLLVIATFMAVGYICLGTYMDLCRPLCNQIGNGELVKSTGHVNFIIILGTLVGVGFGALGMISAFAGDVGIVMSSTAFVWFLMGFSVVFGATFATLLFVDGPRRYQRLEQ